MLLLMKEITDKIRLQLQEVESLNLIFYLLNVARAIGSCVLGYAAWSTKFVRLSYAIFSHAATLNDSVQIRINDDAAGLEVIFSHPHLPC